jgi:transposase
MTRQQKDPLRLLTPAETTTLTKIRRSANATVAQVARATILLAVADGATDRRAADLAARRSPHAVAALVAHFNQVGLTALDPPHGGGPTPRYTTAQRDRILAEAQRVPDRAQDGTATWSLTTLQRALRRAPDGLPQVSRYTLWIVLRDAGWRWQRNRSWCPTGTAVRRRKSGLVTVHDPDTTPKKT